MSENSLKKFLNRPSPFPPTNQKVVVLSDSKGRYLEKNRQPQWNVKFYYKSGRRLAEGLYWLRGNIRYLNRANDTVHLYVWLGTCDLTRKVGSQLELRHSSLEECYSCVTQQICRFYRLVSQYPSIKIIFLEIPPYSMVQWHQTKHVVVDDSLHRQEFELYKRICLVNEFIQEKNDSLHVISPRFKLDLTNIRKAAGKESRRSISFRHYIDGIHPSDLLSVVWLKRIIECSFRLCYESCNR